MNNHNDVDIMLFNKKTYLCILHEGFNKLTRTPLN